MLRGSGWVFVRVRVSFGDALRRASEVLFLVDTGSFFPIIPLRLAGEYGLKALANITVVASPTSPSHTSPLITFLTT
jgi:hypothetical protein